MAFDWGSRQTCWPLHWLWQPPSPALPFRRSVRELGVTAVAPAPRVEGSLVPWRGRLEPGEVRIGFTAGTEGHPLPFQRVQGVLLSFFSCFTVTGTVHLVLPEDFMEVR